MFDYLCGVDVISKCERNSVAQVAGLSQEGRTHNSRVSEKLLWASPKPPRGPRLGCLDCEIPSPLERIRNDLLGNRMRWKGAVEGVLEGNPFEVSVHLCRGPEAPLQSSRTKT